MITTANLTELNKFIKAEIGDPHHLLGMHEIFNDGKKELSVRVFMPIAKSVSVIDPNDQTFCCELNKIHEDGFFEAVLEGKSEWFRYKLRIENIEVDAKGETIWETYDPYSFEPVITEFDLQLFGEGTHYKIYEKLGAHIVEIDGVSGVLFAIWAPDAKRVSVIGDFNKWDERRNQMRHLQHSGVWELFVPGLRKDEIYKFEILNKKGQASKMTDPYGNSFEALPGDCSVVCGLDDYKWNDSKWLKKRSAWESNPPSGAISIYEAHLGSWKRRKDGGLMSYTELADEIVPYVKEMNYTHISLLPIMEHRNDEALGYEATGYFAPTFRYGDPSEFMYFIDKCHQNNIGVILCWQPNASDYSGGKVKNFFIGSALFWLDKYHVDGLKIDSLSSVIYSGGGRSDSSFEFIKHLNSIVPKLFPGTFTIAGESAGLSRVSDSVDSGGIGFGLKKSVSWTRDILSYMAIEADDRLFSGELPAFAAKRSAIKNKSLILAFSCEEARPYSLLNRMSGDLWRKCAGMKQLLAFKFGCPGMKQMFMGGEFGQLIEWNSNCELDWFLLEHACHKQIKQFATDLNKLYKKEKALSEGSFEWSDLNGVMTFVRKTEEASETLIFAFNFSAEPKLAYTVNVGDGVNYKEKLNSDSKKYGGSGVVNSKLLTPEDGKIEIKVPTMGVVVLAVK